MLSLDKAVHDYLINLNPNKCSKELVSVGLTNQVDIVVPTTTTRRGIHESPKHKEQSQNSTNIKSRERTHANNDLTRFGLNAYVLEAIRERLYYF